MLAAFSLISIAVEHAYCRGIVCMRPYERLNMYGGLCRVSNNDFECYTASDSADHDERVDPLRLRGCDAQPVASLRTQLELCRPCRASLVFAWQPARCRGQRERISANLKDCSQVRDIPIIPPSLEVALASAAIVFLPSPRRMRARVC